MSDVMEGILIVMAFELGLAAIGAGLEG